jgi:Na+/H+ antiporter NhaA
MEAGAADAPYSARTAWVRNLETPLRSFLRTETGSAAVLLAATLAALVWVNLDAASYARVWDAQLSIRLGGSGIAHDLRWWVNSGLMTLFFFVVGLEARREFDMGELRERRRLALPVAAGLGGMVVPVAIFLAFNTGHGTAHGWGVAMSTDTAFALGMLALVGPGLPGRLRAFMLTVAVVDDVVALVVIAVAYSTTLHRGALMLGATLCLACVAATVAGVRNGAVYAGLGVAAWVALSRSGIDPIVVGLLLGLLTVARPASRDDLERATGLFRLFREQPTPDLAREARVGVAAAISPNDRLQQLWHPWTSYAIVPLFALANAGIVLDRDLLDRALHSPLTLGIVVGYLVGKPVGIVGASALVTRLSRGRVRPPVGWAALTGGGAIAGIGFTVSLLIAGLAFAGDQLAEAKIGILAGALCASCATWLVFRATALLPRRVRIRALLGSAEPLVDLAVPVEPARDHLRGPQDALVTLVEYGDFECPYCGQAEAAIRELLAEHGDLRYVWRHLPLNDVHPHAQLAAEAAEAAAEQGRFWDMHDLLLARQDELTADALVAAAAELGLDTERFRDDLDRREGAGRIAEDVDGADRSGVSGTPTFFVNGRRHHGAYDVATLTQAVRLAKARASMAVR